MTWTRTGASIRAVQLAQIAQTFPLLGRVQIVRTALTAVNLTVTSVSVSAMGFGFLVNVIVYADIDECEAKLDNCNQTCINEAPSFRCECNDGFRLENDFECIGKSDHFKYIMSYGIFY